MAGLYIHIPFCVTRCIYCDFYSNTRLEYRDAYVAALLREMEIRSDTWQNEVIETIYFGGGTPSILHPKQLQRLFDGIYHHFTISNTPEITIEANPDDISDFYITSLTETPVNRISIGIQSFNDSELRLLNRRHTASEAIEAVARCQTAGLTNISIDLMYGLPEQTTATWSQTIEKALELNVSHLSAYNLSYEEGTAIHQMKENKTIHPIEDDDCEQLYQLLSEKLTNAGFVHYEISNFARRSPLYPNGRISLHNSSYWNGTHYLGLGPSAHSYDGKTRSWNISSLSEYIEAIHHHPETLSETEQLDDRKKYNDFIITRLRTMWGISLDELRHSFGQERERYFLEKAKPLISSNKLKNIDGKIKVPQRVFFLSDAIMRELIV